jgi:hypothetical protein
MDHNLIFYKTTTMLTFSVFIRICSFRPLKCTFIIHFFCYWLCLTLFQSTYAKLGCTQGWFLASLTHPPNRLVHVDPSLIAQRIYVFLLWFLGCCYPAEWIHEPSNIGPCCKFMKVNSGDICYTNKWQTWCYRAPTIVWPKEGLVPLWIFYYRQAYLAYQEADSMAQTRDLWSHSNNSNQPITSTIYYMIHKWI